MARGGPAYQIAADRRGANPGHGFEVTFTAAGAEVGVPPGGPGLRWPEPEATAARRCPLASLWRLVPASATAGAGLTERFVNLPQGLGQLCTPPGRELPVGPGHEGARMTLEVDDRFARSPGRDAGLGAGVQADRVAGRRVTG